MRWAPIKGPHAVSPLRREWHVTVTEYGSDGDIDLASLLRYSPTPSRRIISSQRPLPLRSALAVRPRAWIPRSVALGRLDEKLDALHALHDERDVDRFRVGLCIQEEYPFVPHRAFVRRYVSSPIVADPNCEAAVGVKPGYPEQQVGRFAVDCCRPRAA